MKNLTKSNATTRQTNRLSKLVYTILISILTANFWSNTLLFSQPRQQVFSQPRQGVFLQPRQQEDFYFFERKKVSVIIMTNQIGILAKEGVPDRLIKEFINSLELKLLREFHGILFVVFFRIKSLVF
ncbi:hypothetical protein ES703_92319 [subsurface metagenome]